MIKKENKLLAFLNSRAAALLTAAINGYSFSNKETSTVVVTCVQASDYNANIWTFINGWTPSLLNMKIKALNLFIYWKYIL